MDRRSFNLYNLTKQMIVIALLSFVFLFNPFKATAQYGIELGFAGGTSYYMGDINNVRHFYKPHLNLGGTVKFHFSNRVILRLGFFSSGLSGNDADFKNVYQQIRNSSFDASLNELSAQVEINFLPYLYGDVSRNSFSPYLQTGIVGSWIARDNSDENLFTLGIPIGFGFKKNILPRLVVSIEWGFRFCFTDLIDGITGEKLKQDYSDSFGTPITQVNNAKQLGFKYTNDWYSAALVSLSYTFKVGGLGCPAYYKKRQK